MMIIASVHIYLETQFGWTFLTSQVEKNFIGRGPPSLWSVSVTFSISCIIPSGGVDIVIIVNRDLDEATPSTTPVIFGWSSLFAAIVTTALCLH